MSRDGTTGAGSQPSGGSQGGIEEMSYGEANEELEEIVRFFEDREVDVDQLVGRLERATAIIEEMDKRLRRTKLQVEQLVPRLAQVLEADADAAAADADTDADTDADAAIGGAGGAGSEEPGAPSGQCDHPHAPGLF